MIDHPQYKDGLKPQQEKHIREQLDKAYTIEVNAARRLLGQLYKEREKARCLALQVVKMTKE